MPTAEASSRLLGENRISVHAAAAISRTSCPKTARKGWIFGADGPSLMLENAENNGGQNICTLQVCPSVAGHPAGGRERGGQCARRRICSEGYAGVAGALTGATNGRVSPRPETTIPAHVRDFFGLVKRIASVRGRTEYVVKSPSLNGLLEPRFDLFP